VAANILLVMLLLVFHLPLRAQTTVLSEGFEGAFPGAWTVVDNDPLDGLYTWRDVNSDFGSEATHSGSWKGYCAGTRYAPFATELNPVYTNNMAAVMSQSINLAPYVSAQLSFWFKVPFIEANFDFCRVFIDGTKVWEMNSVVPSWTQVVISLDAYVGATHTLAFEFDSDESIVHEGWYLDDILVTGTAPPANDNFVNATVISGSSGSISGSTLLATKETGEPDHAGISGGHSIWYRWTAPASGAFTFFTQGSGFDTLLGIYTGVGVGSLTLVGSDDDVPSGNWSGVSFEAVSGTTYQIALDGYAGASGNTVLNWLQPTVTETILSSAVANYTGYVIDSDANRDYIQVDASVRSDNSSATTQPTTYRLVFRLLDALNNPHPIFDENGQASLAYNQTNELVVGGFANVTANLSAFLRPAARLDRYQQYHVETRVFRFSVGGSMFTDASNFYTHFTNRVSGDAAFNVIGVLVSAPFDRAYAIKTAPGKTAFSVRPFYGLYRYDNFAGANVADVIPMTFDCVLSNVTIGGTVALKQSRMTASVSVNSYQSGSPITPSLVLGTAFLDLEPQDNVQLDSVNHLFKAYLSLSITNTPGQPAMAANHAASPDQRLLHFNGKIFFGAIETQFASIANVPPVNSVSAPTRLASELAVDGNSGFIVGKPNHKYGTAVPLSIDLFVNGDARYTGVGNVPVNLPLQDTGQVARVRFQRQSAFLNTAGLFANVRVWLPTGFGYRFTDTTSRRVLGTIDFANVPLAQMLQPVTDLTVTPPVPGESIFACEESKPFWIAASSLTWHVNTGVFEMAVMGSPRYVRADELSQLESAPIPADARGKVSNEQYFRSVASVETAPSPTVAPDVEGTALLTCRVNFGASTSGYDTHFPYKAHIQWINAGVMVISNDLVDTAASSLNGVQPITLSYARDCEKPTNCPPTSTAGDTNISLVTPANIAFTLDGGLATPGSISPSVPLEWGWVSQANRFAQRSFSYGQAGFHMPGVFMRGDQTGEASDHRATILLFTGVNASNVTHIERYGTDGYKDGFTDYAGFNFRVGSTGAKQGESTLAGVGTGAYQLTGRSKYYIRSAGVSGIHEALIGTFPGSLTLYGYSMTFSNYGLSYLDNENKESRTVGDIRIPYPAHFTQEFEELKFSCLGALDSAKVPASSGVKPLEYWIGKFQPLAIQFETDPCDATVPGAFTLGIATSVAHVPQQLFARMGFETNGQILNLSPGTKGAKYNISSRLRLPNRLALRGPQDEAYEFNTVTEAYFNHEADAPTGTTGLAGFVSWAGSLDVPFFENIKTHLHTSANTNSPSAPIHLMGGWPAHGWSIGPSTFFTDPNGFDLGHRAFDGSSLADYRNNPTSAQYHPRAQQSWLGVVNFDYPLKWSSSTRSFTFFKPETNEFLVIKISHQVNYLSAQNAELTFGAEYGGVPKISLANIAFNALNEVAGVESALTNTIGKASHALIEEGMKRLTDLLNAQLRNFFDPVFAQVVDPTIDALYGALTNTYLTTWPGVAVVNASSIQPYATSVLATRLQDILGANTNVAGVLKQVNDSLNDVDKAMGEIQTLMAKDGGGNRTISRQLIKNLVGQLAAEFIGSFTDPLLNDLLKDADPTLTQIEKTLAELRKALADARKRLGGDFKAELEAQISIPELAAAADAVRSDITNTLAQLDTSLGSPLQELSREQFKKLVRQKIEDRFFETAVSANIQRVFKERIYDLDASIRESVDSAFQQFNGIMRDIIAKSLAQVDKSIDGFLGDVGKAMGHGQINGYAHIKGDSLNLLRLDGHFQWKVPDTMEFKAFLQIKELQSDGTNKCSVAGGKATEVTVGAPDVAVKWISPDLRANISGKFSFRTLPGFRVIGMGGAFEITGPLTFQVFQITELGAAMAFGESENYLAAKARVKFNQYELAGGVFFGKTCTLEPLLMVDKFVAEVLPAPPLTGAYIYGEGGFPINEALGIPSSCFFNVRVKIGAGAFFFLAGDKEVPTFGGKMLLGVSGEVLCIIYVAGEVKLVGLKSGDDLTFRGRGELSARLGFCPFCISFSKGIGMTYKQGGWGVDF
jgi:hypothetical protein